MQKRKHGSCELFFRISNRFALGFNDHGYSEHTVIANKPRCVVWFSICYAKRLMLLANKNKHITITTNKTWEIIFLIA